MSNTMAYEGDIVSRLRHWRGLHLAHGGRLYEEAADEIERLREERRWIPVAERLPDEDEPVLWHGPGDTFCRAVVGKVDGRSIDWGSDLNMDIARNFTHWQPLPPPPEATP